MIGYSLSLAKRNKQASTKLLGVRLGRVCIAKDVPVIEVANALGVTRQTVYNWFGGATSPAKDLESAVLKLIARYSK